MSKDTPAKIVATTFWRTADGWETYNEGYRAGLSKAIDLTQKAYLRIGDPANNFSDAESEANNYAIMRIRQALEAELEKEK